MTGLGTTVALTINGETHTVRIPAHEMLVQTLRERMALTGTKIGCDIGICGACTVLVNGRLMSSCLVPTARLGGSEILTVEGLSQGEDLHPLQRQFAECGAVQCGFCTPGMLMTTYYLLEHKPDASEAELREFIHGNYCRCTGYVKIVQAVLRAQADLKAQARV